MLVQTKQENNNYRENGTESQDIFYIEYLFEWKRSLKSRINSECYELSLT